MPLIQLDEHNFVELNAILSVDPQYVEGAVHTKVYLIGINNYKVITKTPLEVVQIIEEARNNLTKVDSSFIDYRKIVGIVPDGADGSMILMAGCSDVEVYGKTPDETYNMLYPREEPTVARRIKE